jgi:hypothetical protein
MKKNKFSYNNMKQLKHKTAAMFKRIQQIKTRVKEMFIKDNRTGDSCIVSLRRRRRRERRRNKKVL